MGTCDPAAAVMASAKKKRKPRSRQTEWSHDLLSHKIVVKKWMTLDEHGHFRNCSLYNFKLVTRWEFDHRFIIKHLCGRKHLEEVEKKKHAKAIVARGKRNTETNGIM